MSLVDNPKLKKCVDNFESFFGYVANHKIKGIPTVFYSYPFAFWYIESNEPGMGVLTLKMALLGSSGCLGLLGLLGLTLKIEEYFKRK